MNKRTLVFSEDTQSIRQMPENYLVASREFGVWTTMHIDLAVDRELGVKVFLELLNFESKYNLGGDELVSKLNVISQEDALIYALEELVSNINLSTLNIKKDFSLINAHAYALKVLSNIKNKCC